MLFWIFVVETTAVSDFETEVVSAADVVVTSLLLFEQAQRNRVEIISITENSFFINFFSRKIR